MSKPGTPLPWATENQGRVIVNATGELIVGDHGMTEAVAVYIVEACNAYPQLMSALRKLVEAAKDKQWDGVAHCEGGPKRYCSNCCKWRHEGHHRSCPYAAAIAEAERLLEGGE